MKRKLLLINPALTSPTGRRRLSVAGLATMEPLGLAYVAALTPSGWDVYIVDEVAEEIPRDFRPDLVGLTSLTPTAPRAYEIASGFRAQGVPVVMGGMHATLCPGEAARYVDVVFCGEAEGAWPRRPSRGGRLRCAVRGAPGATRAILRRPPSR